MNWRTCACGCGKQIRAVGRRKYLNRAHQAKAYRRRKQARVTIAGSSGSADPSWSRNNGGSASVHVEIVGVHTDHPGYRVVELLDLRGESLRIRYLGPGGGERLITRDQVHGVVVEGKIFREEAQQFLEALTMEAAG